MEESREFLTEFGQKSCLFSEEEVAQLRSSGCFVSENDLEGEITDWALQYLHVNKCPHNLAVFLARETCYELIKDDCLDSCCEDFKGIHEKSNAGNGDAKDIIRVFNSRKLLRAVHLKVHEVCRNWMNKKEMDFLEKCNHRVVSVSAIKNTRRRMEDRHLIISNLSLMGFSCEEQLGFYAIFDGHAGAEAAVFASSYLLPNIASHPFFPLNIEEAIKDGFQKTEKDFLEKPNKENTKSGTTVLCAFISSNKITVAWVGDSQAVLVRSGASPVNLVIPHKPDRVDERNRIENLGGNVVHFGTWRVNGVIAVSRAIGDVDHKPYIISDPEISTLPLEGSEDFVILACDGLWDVLSSEDAANIIYRHLLNNPDDIEGISQELVQAAVQKGSNDNITVLVVFLRSIKDIISNCPKICPVEVPFSAGNLESIIEDSESLPNESYNFDITKNMYNSKMPIQKASPVEVMINKSEQESSTSEHSHDETTLNGMNGENSEESKLPDDLPLKLYAEHSSQSNLWITSEDPNLLPNTHEEAIVTVSEKPENSSEVGASSLPSGNSFEIQNVQEYFLAHHTETVKFDLELESGLNPEVNPNSLLSSFDSKPLLSPEDFTENINSVHVISDPKDFSENISSVHATSDDLICPTSEVSDVKLIEDKPSESTTSSLSIGNEMESPTDTLDSDSLTPSLPLSSNSVNNLNAVKEMVQSESLSLEPITVEKIPETLPVADDVVDDESEDGDDWRYYHPSSIASEDGKNISLHMETKDNSSGSNVLFEGNNQSLTTSLLNDGNAIETSKTDILVQIDNHEISVTKDTLCIIPSDDNLKDLSMIKDDIQCDLSIPTEMLDANKDSNTRSPETSTPTKNGKIPDEVKANVESTKSVAESNLLVNTSAIHPVEPVSSVEIVPSAEKISPIKGKGDVLKTTKKSTLTSKNVTSSTLKSTVSKSHVTSSTTQPIARKPLSSKPLSGEKKPQVSASTSSPRALNSAPKSTLPSSKGCGTRPAVRQTATSLQQDVKVSQGSTGGTLPKRGVHTLPNRPMKKPAETSVSSSATKLKTNQNEKTALTKSSVSQGTLRPTAQKNIPPKMPMPTLSSSSKQTKDTLNKKISSTTKHQGLLNPIGTKVDLSKPKTLTNEKAAMSGTVARKPKSTDVKSKTLTDQGKTTSKVAAASGTIKKVPARAVGSIARKPKVENESPRLKEKKEGGKILPSTGDGSNSKKFALQSKEKLNATLGCNEKGSLDESSKETVQVEGPSSTELCSGDSSEIDKKDIHLGEGDAGVDISSSTIQ